MHLTPSAAVDLVTDSIHKYLFYLPGGGEGKSEWIETLTLLLEQEGMDLYLSSSVFSQKHYAGDVLNHFANARQRVFVLQSFSAFYRDEVTARGIATAAHLRFVYVDNFLSEENQKTRPIWEPVDPATETGPPAIIVDLDGTLMDSSHRSPYGAPTEEILADKVIEHVAEVVTLHYWNGATIIYLTARGEYEHEYEATAKSLTQAAMLDPNNPRTLLFSRRVGDNRDDALVKYELFNQHVRGQYKVRLVLDDRPRVIRMWHALGLPVLANKAYERGEF